MYTCHLSFCHNVLFVHDKVYMIHRTLQIRCGLKLQKRSRLSSIMFYLTVIVTLPYTFISFIFFLQTSKIRQTSIIRESHFISRNVRCSYTSHL